MSEFKHSALSGDNEGLLNEHDSQPTWDFHPLTPPLKQKTPHLNRGSTHFLLESFVRHLRILLAWLSLRHGSDTTLNEHDSPQWYDIVHFEHKLS